MPFPVAVLGGMLLATIVGIIVGIPSVRVRGINLAIATLALGAVIEYSILADTGISGGDNGLPVKTPSLFGLSLAPAAHPERYAALCVILAGLTAIAVANLRRGRSGRRFVTVRANERGAASVGISVYGAKLGAFAVSSGIAGLAGALSAYRYPSASFQDSTFFQSILTVAATVIGGVGFVAGAFFAGVGTTGGIFTYVAKSAIGVNPNDINIFIAILTGVATMDIMVRFPDGATVMFANGKQRVMRLILRKSPTPVVHPEPSEHLTQFPKRASGASGGDMFRVRGLTVAYGQTVAVNDVDIDIVAGEIVGVIGPNGAGKTTLIEAITGFAKARSGTIELNGRSLDDHSPHQLARMGIGRTFQNLELFEDLTVRENLLAALDKRDLAAYLFDLFHPGRHGISVAATAAVELLGLTPYLDMNVADLPQGRRRMVAIARVVAQNPTVVCLDEPAAGLSGPERRTLGALLRSLAVDFNAAVLLVEHNVDLVGEVCDRLVVLDFGNVIAGGTTQSVLANPAVVEAYLGTSGKRDVQRASAPADTPVSGIAT